MAIAPSVTIRVRRPPVSHQYVRHQSLNASTEAVASNMVIAGMERRNLFKCNPFRGFGRRATRVDQLGYA